MRSSRKILEVLVLFYVFMLTGACQSTGGALPQTSIPLPENDPITISSPDSAGFVVVTGAQNAVPASVKVIISVSSSGSYLNRFEYFWSWLVTNAVAQTGCTSSLSECPTLTSGKCQVTADADGGFQFSLPAAQGDTISIDYLNPEKNCAQTDAFSASVTGGIVSVDLKAVAMDLAMDPDGSANELLILGTRSDTTQIDIRSISDGSLVATLEPDMEGTPEDVAVMADHSGDQVAVLQSSQETQIVPYSDHSINENQQKDLVLESGGTPVENLSFRAVDTFTYPPATDTDCISSAHFQSGQTYTRVFFTDNQKLYILDSIDDFSDNSQSGDELIVRKVTLQLVDFPDVSVVKLPFVGMLDSTFVVVAGFSDGSSDEVTYYAIEISQDSGFCSGNLDVSSDAKRIQMAKTSDAVFAALFELFDSSGEAVFRLGVLKEDTQNIKFIDATNMELAETISVRSAVSEYDDLAISDVVRFLGLQRRNSSVFELFLLGKDNGGAGFVASDNSATTFGSGTLANVINPVGLEYDAVLEKIIVLDAGLSGSEKANLILIDIGE